MTMKRLIVLGVLLGATCATIAAKAEYRQLTEAEKKLIATDVRKLSKEDVLKRRAAVKLMRDIESGGFCIVPGTPKGCIRIVNLQKIVKTDAIGEVTNVFSSLPPYDIKIVDSDCKAEVKIKVVDEKSIPALTICPDEGIATVNVSKLTNGTEKTTFLAARVRKEILRAFAYMTASSTYGTTFLGRMKSPKDLDDCAATGYPVDVIMRSTNYLKSMGVFPTERSTYKHVLKRGFDIAPTNEFQRVIYDRVKKERAEGQKK